jgi:hypothetical protein
MNRRSIVKVDGSRSWAREPSGATVAHFVVGYFDILGQSDQLKTIPKYSDDPGEQERIGDRIIETVGPIIHLRRNLAQFFEKFDGVSLADMPRSSERPERMDAARDYESAKLNLQGFSDTVLAFSPLGTDGGDISLLQTGRLMIAAVRAFLEMLARGHAIRGSIDVGLGIDYFDGEIYGPALLSVHQLEKGAGWPRVVIGDGLVDVWQSLIRIAEIQNQETVNSRFARKQLSWCVRDPVDGQMFLDLVSDELLELLGEGPFNNGTIWQLADVAQLRAGILQERYQTNSEVGPKYDRLVAYLRKRRGQLLGERRRRATELVGPC